jgi:dolichyl-phosphate beta-glucosyltransferase
MLKKKIDKISFIIPVFNEEKRLNFLFKNIYEFKKNYNFFKTEFIIIDDGSTDDSLKIMNLNKKKINLKIITYSKNKGKGYALKQGILAAKYDWILTVDADLSTKLNQMIAWKNNYSFVSTHAYFGSRSHPKSSIKFKLSRLFMGKCLNLVLYFFLGIKIKDTQCGFKLYNSKYIKKIFKEMNIYDFSHDIKVTQLLLNNNIKIIELPIKWAHKDGSKVRLIKDSLLFLNNIIFKYF